MDLLVSSLTYVYVAVLDTHCSGSESAQILTKAFVASGVLFTNGFTSDLSFYINVWIRRSHEI